MAGFKVNYQNNIPGVDYNDLYLDEFGNIAFVTDPVEETIETCHHAVLLTIGDYVFNTLLGIPWNQYLGSPTPIGNKLKKSIIQAVLAVSGVASVQSFNAVLTTSRVLNITIVINLIEGNSATINLPIEI